MTEETKRIEADAKKLFPIHYNTDSGYHASWKQEGYIAGATAEYLRSEPVKVSDTTGDDSITEAGKQKTLNP